MKAISHTCDFTDEAHRHHAAGGGAEGHQTSRMLKKSSLAEDLNAERRKVAMLDDVLKNVREEIALLKAKKEQDDSLAASLIDQRGEELSEAQAILREQLTELNANKKTIVALQEGSEMKDEYIVNVLNDPEQHSLFKAKVAEYRESRALLESERIENALTVEKTQDEIDALNSKSAKFEIEIERAEMLSSLEEARKLIKELNEVASKLEKERNELDSALDLERKRVESAKAKVELLEVAVETARDENKRLNREFKDNVESVNAETRDKVELLQVAAKEKREEIKLLKQKIQESTESVKSTARAALKVEREEAKRLNEVIEDIMKKKSGIEATHENVTHKVQGLQKAIDSKDASTTKLKSSIDKYKKAQVALAVKAVKCEESRQQILKELSETSKKLEATKWTAHGLEEKVKAANKKNEVQNRRMRNINMMASSLLSNVNGVLQPEEQQKVPVHGDGCDGPSITDKAGIEDAKSHENSDFVLPSDQRDDVASKEPTVDEGTEHPNMRLAQCDTDTNAKVVYDQHLASSTHSDLLTFEDLD